MRAASTALSVALTSLVIRSAAAQSLDTRPSEAKVDRFELSARSETYAALFRRALLPGPGGALVDTETFAPIYQYVQLTARDLDLGPQEDSVSFEASGFVRVFPSEVRFEEPLDGDVQTAFVSYQHGPGSLRLGRQHFAGGAARFARFDGGLLSLDLGSGLAAQAYGGLTVLPRWNERPGYHHLGSPADSLLRDPEALEQPHRRGHWQAGGRFAYTSLRYAASASFHEQREQGELAHRNVGVDGRVRLGSAASAFASAILDADALSLADARVWLDVTPLEPLSLSFEYLHTEPALWLSRQAVLSVFSSDRFDEAGGLATWRLTRAVRVEGSAFATIYDDHRPGARAEGTLRVTPDALSVVRLSYTRVLAPSNGYHSLRGSLSRRLRRPLLATLEMYAYFYDRPIRAYRSSTVYAGTLSYEPTPTWSFLSGASLSRTPYAALDAQILLRAAYAFDHAPRGLP